MANRKLSMNKLRQVLRCHANGNGAKSISNLTGIARNTVRKYLRRFMELNRGIEDLLKGSVSLSVSEASSLKPVDLR